MPAWRRPNRFCFWGAVVALLAFGPPVSSAALAPPLVKLILRPTQVGPGYELKLRPDSYGVKNTVTMVMCGYTFRSELLRTARLQVNYARLGSVVGLSNEVVIYRRGGAERAMNEVRQAASQCPRGPVKSGIAGVGPLTYRLGRLSRPPGLLPGAIALIVHLSGDVNGQYRATTSVVVYQSRGNALSGVYGDGGSLAAQMRLVMHAAIASATNLKTG
jgi:hypothetical protein